MYQSTTAVEILPPETALEILPAEGNIFALAYQNTAVHQLRAAWAAMRDRWLHSNRKGRPNSAHTRRAYEAATAMFEQFVGLDWWLVDAGHVRGWQEAMEAERRLVHGQEVPLSRATINQRMSAVSSFYSYILREQRLGADGIERGLFFDANGHTRANPFRANNLERITVVRKGKSLPISPAVLIHMINDIKLTTGDKNHRADCLEGLRDNALLRTFLLTGWRSSEVLEMQWGDIRPNDDRPGEFIFAWSGKGSKEQDDSLPAALYHAIVAYLKAAGRWLPGHPQQIQPGEYIWQPIRPDAACHGLKNVDPAQLDPKRHISASQANNILRKHLRRALRSTGLTAAEAEERAQRYHIHSLRHTFAHNMRKGKFDVLKISKLMHHSSIAVTQLYLDSLEAPVDDYSQVLQMTMGI